MAYLSKRRRSSLKKSKVSSIELEVPTVLDLPMLKRKRTLALNRLKRTHEVALEATENTSMLNSFLAHFSEIQKLRTKFEEAHEDILSIVDVSSEESEDKIRIDFDELYYNVITIHKKLTKDNDSSQSTKDTSLHVRLPKINVPTFSGNIKSWPEFYDIFKSLIHDRGCLSDTEKMQYLMSSLKGDALGLIKTFPLQGTFYQEAFKTLVSRYRDKRELAFTCWKEMLNVVIKPSSPLDFRRVLDMFQENLSILKGIGLPTDQWDFILCYLLLSKLDSKTRYEYEQSHTSVELPRYTDLRDFLYSKCESLMRDYHFSAHPATDKPRSYDDKPRSSTSSHTLKKASALVATKSEPVKNSHDKPSDTKKPSSSAHPVQTIQRCSFCDKDHSIVQCNVFCQKSIDDRLEHAKSHHWCFNCLRPSHSLKDCKSIFRCRECNQRHHTLLHRSPSIDDATSNVPTTASHGKPTADRAFTTLQERSMVLLSTAKIHLRDSSGLFQPFRALIDSGSQAHFITDNAVKRLGLNQAQTSRQIRGLGQSAASVSGSVQVEIGVNGKTLFQIDALSLPTICSDMPSARLNPSSWRHLQHLSLADPDCHKPGPIDMLLGAEVFSSLLLPGNLTGGSHEPSAINSVFGWLLLGNVTYKSESFTNSLFSSEDNNLHREVQNFWELENIPNLTRLTPEEEGCEQFFVQTVSRDSTGRYVVALPFKKGEDNHLFLGSKEKALRRFHSLERKLRKVPAIREQYVAFMEDYLKSGHMSRVPVKEIHNGKYYIPHHCILRPESVTTKLRVVFDASAKDDNNVSLNERLLSGPKLQTNILELLLKFRVHSVVFTADMRQMYRQLLLREQDRDFQRIFWRSDELGPVLEYRLNTVTYGVSSAPFLACRTVKQLIADEGSDLPHASRVLESDIYIDDIVSGGSNLEAVRRTKDEIIQLLNRGHLELRKWASNIPELLSDLPSDHCLIDLLSMDIGNTMEIKILGLKWDPIHDVFTFEVTPRDVKCNKRNILSELARIFDPLGFLAPMTFVAKLLVQKLWILGIDWDTTPPEEIVSMWERYTSQLPCIKLLKIPRCVSIAKAKTFQLHGFSDASESGYGAVIYLRVEDENGDVKVFFLCAKSRVAPIKRVSLPRLELCAAVLLSDLVQFVKRVYGSSLSISDIYTWSDSMVVLFWLRSHASRWKTFVSNRVGHIQSTIPEARWNHVASADNPADIPSRGMGPESLVNSSLWWAGPSWLFQPSEFWPSLTSQEDPIESQCEERDQSVFVAQDNDHIIDHLLERISSIRKIQRIVGYCLRFIRNARIHDQQSRNRSTFLTRSEQHSALMNIVKHVQSQHFSEEIHRLNEGLPLSKPFRKLHPFLDNQGVIRVGGRLSRSGLDFEHKHPAFLPRHSKLTFMIIESFHRENCHAGVNTMHYLLNQQFWILSAKRAIRHCLSKCIPCYRTNPTPLEPFMSDLPAVRVNQVKPFSIVGVDYGGPFSIKSGRHRGAKVTKAYLCLFVCFTTKALHLELVSELSTDAFVAAVRRFVGRRGRVNIIHSDRGTNFVGTKSLFDSYMANASQAEQIEFRFNAPSSPHFGGVWEIQIKVVKTHLYRIVGTQCLTFEELTTLFVQIEAMLNSRPLCPMSSDPNDLSVLTPGHFLTLEPLTAVPDQDLSQIKITRLGRWQLIQRFQQDFWKRWKSEYLHTLTQRAKWTSNSKPLLEGSIVLIKHDNAMPLHWAIARVLKLHPGPDGVVRVATVRTAQTTLTRPLAKLCPLPSQCE